MKPTIISTRFDWIGKSDGSSLVLETPSQDVELTAIPMPEDIVYRQF